MSEPVAQPWSPSARLRAWLLAGAWAALAEVLLSAVSYAYFWEELRAGIDAAPEAAAEAGEKGGLAVDAILDLFIVIPQLLVLLALLALARELRSRGLWISSLGFHLCLWAALAFLTIDPELEGLPVWIFVVPALAAAGTIIFLAASTSRFSRPAAPAGPEPAPVGEQEEKSTEEMKKKEDDSTWGAILLMVGVAISARLLKGQLRRLGIGWETVWLVLGVILGLATAGFLVALGVIKIRLRGRLGAISAASGAFDIAMPVVALAALAGMIAIGLKAGVDDPDELLARPEILAMGATVTAVELAGGLLTAALFLAARNRGRAEFDRLE